MGFRVPVTTEIVLEFPEDDPVTGALHGASVRCRSVPAGEAEAMDALAGKERDTALVNEVVIEWDLIDDRGERVPLTVDGLAKLPAWVPTAIWRGWFRGLFTPPAPLSRASTNGAVPQR